MTRKWHWRDLFTDHKTGVLVETKLWSNVGKFLMSVAFVIVVWRGASTEYHWAMFGGVVVLHDLGTRYQRYKERQQDKEKPE